MIALIILFLLTICAWYVISKNRRSKRFWELFNQFNGDDPLPIFGHSLKFGNKSDVILKRLIEMWERNGRTSFRVQMVNMPFILLCEPEHAEVLLRSNKEITKLDDYKFLQGWLGDGLLLSTGRKWQRQRKIITPTFHFKILEQFVSVFNKCGDIFIDKISKNVNTTFDVYPFVTLCSLDIICESAMGTNINAQNDSKSEYVQAIIRISELVHHRSFSLFKRNDLLYRLTPDYYTEKKTLKILHDMSNGVIKTRKIQLKEEIAKMAQRETVPEGEEQFQVKGKTAFLDLLLLSKTAEGEPLSDQIIRDEVDTFMFEGHDTVSSCIAFAIYSLANNPEVQQLAFEEQYSIFGDDVTREVTMSDLNDMSYLERIIKETLRIYPSVPWFGRKISEDLPLPDGKIIPGGTMAIVQPILMARDPKLFPNPDKFDPERFQQEQTVKRNPYLHIPFSAGPRNCIGQKFAMLDIKILLSKVIRNFELSSAGDKYNVILLAEIIIKSKNGMHLIMKKREYDIANGLASNGVTSNGVTSNEAKNSNGIVQ